MRNRLKEMLYAAIPQTLVSSAKTTCGAEFRAFAGLPSSDVGLTTVRPSHCGPSIFALDIYTKITTRGRVVFQSAIRGDHYGVQPQMTSAVDDCAAPPSSRAGLPELRFSGFAVPLLNG